MSGWCHNQGGKRYGLCLQVQPQRRAFGTAGSPSQMPVAVVGWLQVVTCSHKKGCIPKNPNMGHTWKLAISVWNYDKSCFFCPFSGKTNLRNFLIRLVDTALSTSHSRSSQIPWMIIDFPKANLANASLHCHSAGMPGWPASQFASIFLSVICYKKSPERFWSLG
jgi:hypothetical protein